MAKRLMRNSLFAGAVIIIASVGFISAQDYFYDSAAQSAMWVPGTIATMGTNDPKSQANERPTHQVNINGFYIDVHPVTNAQFQ